MRVLVTGASGFVGGAVAARLVNAGVVVRAGVRRRDAVLPSRVEPVIVGPLGPDTDWRPALQGVEAVVHAAARVHVMRERAQDPLGEFRRDNVAGSIALARQAIDAGVRRMVFISSIKVNGESTGGRSPYRATDVPAPADAYGISKHEAEEGLRRLCLGSPIELVIIRPVLVYGPGVKGNFRAMFRWLRLGVPLPLAAVDNRRSFVGLSNLVDLIVTTLHHPAAPGHVFLASDGEDLSTPDLLRRIGLLLGSPARLFPAPVPLINLAAGLIGRRGEAQRLCGSLQVDISEARATLGWCPPVTVQDSLATMVQEYLKAPDGHG